MTALRALQRYARPMPASSPPVEAACELCRNPVDPHRHWHIADLERRTLCCACRACALLFEAPAAAKGRYRTVPERVLHDDASRLDEAQWASLVIPVRLAFVFFNSSSGRWVAFYPGPGGATESELPQEACRDLARSNRLLAAARPDVEAVLAWGGREAKVFRTYLVPIVDCYELVGRVRQSFRGFDGGVEVRRELTLFFDGLRRRSRPLKDGDVPGGAR